MKVRQHINLWMTEWFQISFRFFFLLLFTFYFIRCGCLQVGDRIVAVNHKSVALDGLSADEVTQLLLCAEGCDSGALLTLHVEFDVADAVVPSSGIFSVKLARRGHGLGITITGTQ